MNKVFFVLGFVLLSLTAKSQIQFGAKLGLAIAHLYEVDDGTRIYYNAKAGVVFGGFATIPLKENFSFQPELNYTQDGTIGAGYRFNINYLVIPLNLKYNITEDFAVLGGPEIGILLSTSIDHKRGDISLIMKSADVALAAGAEYEITQHFGVGMKYGIGILNISKIPRTVGRNIDLLLTTHYRF